MPDKFNPGEPVMVRVDGQWIAAKVNWQIGNNLAYHVEFVETFYDSEDYASEGAIVYYSDKLEYTEIKPMEGLQCK